MSDRALPYTDIKPVGAPDFYLCIDATFRFLHARFGMGGLVEYWRDLGTRYRAPVAAMWREGGLRAVARYWRAFYAAEPGAEVEIDEADDRVTIDVRVCPAIRHLRARGREIFPLYCHHCYHVNDATAAAAGLTARVEGGGGACRQIFLSRAAAPAPQDPRAIREAR